MSSLMEIKDGWGWSREKRAQLFQAGMYLLAQRRPLWERWTDGSVSFHLHCHSDPVQDLCYKIFILGWAGIEVLADELNWPSVRAEIVMSIPLIPFMQSDLRSSWRKRVEASDAAPGGHGEAWTHMDEQMVAEAARLCCPKGFTPICTPSMALV